MGVGVVSPNSSRVSHPPNHFHAIFSNFSIELSADGDTRVELPIDPASWDEAFQAGEDGVMAPADDGGLLPGFLFTSALATMTLAAVYLPSRKDSEDTRDRT